MHFPLPSPRLRTSSMRNYLAQIVESQQRFAENPLFSIISTLLMVMIMIMNAFFRWPPHDHDQECFDCVFQVTVPNAALLGAVGLIQTLELPDFLENLVIIIFFFFLLLFFTKITVNLIMIINSKYLMISGFGIDQFGDRRWEGIWGHPVSQVMPSTKTSRLRMFYKWRMEEGEKNLIQIWTLTIPPWSGKMWPAYSLTGTPLRFWPGCYRKWSKSLSWWNVLSTMLAL